jgi:hypothetical protein
MSYCYHFKLDTHARQTGREDSFIGGMPKLPSCESIPRCTLCGREQVFFFQLAFPERTTWSGLTLAVFSCMDCSDENYLIPRMLTGPLLGVDIPEGFLDSYQTNFRFLIFRTASAHPHVLYQERVSFRPISLVWSDSLDREDNKVGGVPNWLLEDESPGSYAGKAPMGFLLQILEGFQFEMKSGALPQMELALDGTPRRSSLPYYLLFNGNRIFLFGTELPGEPMVYAITQLD